MNDEYYSPGNEPEEKAAGLLYVAGMPDWDPISSINKMIDDGLSWAAIGEKCGMSPELAVTYYAYYAHQLINRLRAERVKSEG